MTEPRLNDRERAFVEEVYERRRLGKLSKKRRLEMLADLPVGAVLERGERHHFERAGTLPERLTTAMAEDDPQPAPADAYGILDPVPASFKIKLKPPVMHTPGPPPSRKFGRAISRRYPTIMAVEAREVEGHLKNNLEYFRIGESYIPELTDPRALAYASTLSWDEAPTLDGKSTNLSVTGTAMFSHWTFDVLPRFKILQERGHPIDSFDHIVISTRNAAFGFHDYGLTRLGVDLDKVVLVKDVGPAIRFTHLIEPSKSRDHYYGEPWVYEEVRRIFAGGEPEGGSPGERLFIGRKNTHKRTVLNMDQVQPVLDEFGFVTVYAEDWSIPEFAKIMNGAKVVAGPHGAGFTNIAFCEPGTKVLELYGPHITNEFWGISNTLGFEHHLMAGYDEQGRYPTDPTSFPVASQQERNAAGFNIDPALFRKALNDICGNA